MGQTIFKGFYDLSRKEQARYVDPVCRVQVSDHIFLDDNIMQRDDPQFAMWNETSVANLAYISLYAKEEKHRDRASRLLEEYDAWRQQRGGDVAV